MGNTNDITRQETKININIALIGVATASLFFISGLRPDLIKDNLAFVVQLIAAIPILLSATLALSKSIAVKNYKPLVKYAGYAYSIGYAFILNAVGILVASLTYDYIAYLFFFICILNPVVYSYFLVKYENEPIKKRIKRDGLFILIIILLGVLFVV